MVLHFRLSGIGKNRLQGNALLQYMDYFVLTIKNATHIHTHPRKTQRFVSMDTCKRFASGSITHQDGDGWNPFVLLSQPTSTTRSSTSALELHFTPLTAMVLRWRSSPVSAYFWLSIICDAMDNVCSNGRRLSVNNCPAREVMRVETSKRILRRSAFSNWVRDPPRKTASIAFHALFTAP